MTKNYVICGYAALFGVMLGAACGGPSADQACSDRAKAECAKLDQCKKNGTQVTYGTLGSCIDRVKSQCLTRVMAPTTADDPGFEENCAIALPNESCQDYLQNNPVDDCVVKNGSIAAGAPCAFNGQCQTGFCAVLKGGNCGVCQNTPVAGDPCTDTGCGRNMVCTPNQVCEPYAATGGSCDGKTTVCAPGAVCVIATGMTSGTCQGRGTTVGATCDNKRLTGPDCDPNAGLFCDASTLKCVAYSYANGSQSCGSSNQGHINTLCNGGGLCYNPGGGATCVAAAAEGENCDTSVGPPCLAPARCVLSGATSGTCMLLDGSMCM